MFFWYIFQLKMTHSAWVFVFLFMDTRLQTKTHSRIFQFSEKVIWWEDCITINERLCWVCYSVIFPIPSPLILWSKAFKILKNPFNYKVIIFFKRSIMHNQSVKYEYFKKKKIPSNRLLTTPNIFLHVMWELRGEKGI